MGTPPANTGKCAKAALNTTLEQALMAPKTKNHLAERGQSSGEAKDAGAGESWVIGTGRKAMNGFRALEHDFIWKV